MVDGFYKIVRDIISEIGFRYLLNAKGSHEKWQHPDTGKVLLIPRNLQSRHTANAILKEAGYRGKL